MSWEGGQEKVLGVKQWVHLPISKYCAYDGHETRKGRKFFNIIFSLRSQNAGQ